MEYSVYLKYKPSEVDWLGKIPIHWEVRKLRYFASSVSTGTTPSSNESQYFFEPTETWYTPSDFDDSTLKLKESKRRLNQLAVSEGIVKLFPKNSVLVVGIGATLGRVGIAKESFSCNQQINVIVPEKYLSTDFLAYSLQVKSEIMKVISNATTLGIMNQDKTKLVELCAPDIEEQKQIADFLDYKTTQIDRLIEKKKALIEKLNEKRMALITQAVTKGLNSDAPMKPSGVDWLGDVPAHWDVRKLKFCIDFEGGGTPNTSTKEYWDGNIPWVSPKDMKTEHIFKTQDYITELGLHESATHLIKTGAVLLVVRSGILRHSIPVAINAVPVTINQDMKALIVNRDFLLNEYLMALIYGHQKSLLPTWSKPGCTVESIEFEYMINTLIPLPPIEEQSAIVFKINKEKKKIDAMLDVTNQTIEHLVEYRTALITAAVTGKIDVRAIKISDQEAA